MTAVGRVAAGRTLWLSPVPRTAGAAEGVVVLDAAWTPAPGAPDNATVSMRDAVDEVLRIHDPILVASDLLDEWAAASGVIGLLTVEGTSLWYLVRLRTWLWLEERVIWGWVLRRLLDEHRPTAITCVVGTDQALLGVAHQLAWTAALVLLGQRVMNRGLRRIVVQGG